MAFVAIKIGRRQESGTGVSPVYSVSREWDGRLTRLFRFKRVGRASRPSIPFQERRARRPSHSAYFRRNPSGHAIF